MTTRVLDVLDPERWEQTKKHIQESLEEISRLQSSITLPESDLKRIEKAASEICLTEAVWGEKQSHAFNCAMEIRTILHNHGIVSLYDPNGKPYPKDYQP